MRKLKRIVSAIMSLIMMFTLLSGCGKKNTETDNDADKFITRGAWVEAIGTIWGMDEYTEKVPYFTDVPSDSEIFPYVQSCYEWNVISTDTTEFKKDDVATLGFAVSSATMILLGGDTKITNEELIEDAINYGLLEEKQNNKNDLSCGITSEQADNIISIAQELYLSETQEQICDIQMADGVKDYSNEKDKINKKNDNTYIIDNDIAKSLVNGEVIIAPDEEDISGQIALKVINKKDNGDGTYTISTDIPEMDEVFDSVDIAGTYYADCSQVEPEDGFKVVPLEESTGTSYGAGSNNADLANYITSYDENGKAIQTKDYSINNSKSWKFEGSVGTDGIEAMLTKPKDEGADLAFGLGVNKDGTLSMKNQAIFDNASNVETEFSLCDIDSEIQKALKDNNVDGTDLTGIQAYDAIKDYAAGLISKDSLMDKLNACAEKTSFSPTLSYKAGYSLEGSVSVKNLAVIADIKTKGMRVEKAAVRVSGQIEKSISLKGNINTEIKIGKVAIPLVPGGAVSLCLNFYVYADFNGSVSVKTTVTLDNKVEFEGSKGRKCINNNVDTDVDIEASIEVGPAFGISVNAIGLELVSLRIKVGVMLDAELTRKYTSNVSSEGDSTVITHKLNLALKLTLYLPLVKIELNKTKGCIGGKIFSATWTPIDKSVIDKGKKTESGIGNLCVKKELINIDNDLYQAKFIIRKVSNPEETGLGDYISLDHMAINVFVGEKSELVIENMPNGYDESDIVWNTDDEKIAIVKNGVVTGVGEGTTTVHAVTSDGNYNVACLVTVSK